MVTNLGKKDSKTKKASGNNKEIEKVLNEARVAEDEFRLLDASRLYLLASRLSSDIGEFEKARELTNKSNELKRREEDLKKRSQVEKERIRDSKLIKNLKREMDQAIEIAEIAINEKRWSDASKFYFIAARHAETMGDFERTKVLKKKAEELQKRRE